MKNFHAIFFTALISILILASCDQGPKPVEIGELKTYSDPATKFSVLYPSNWNHQSVAGARFVAFSHDQVRRRFNQYDSQGFPGAKMDVVVVALDSTRNLDSVIAGSKIFDPSLYETANTTVGGVEGKKLSYSFELEDGMFNGLMIFATKDGGRATVLTFETFAGSYEVYKDKFDEIIASLQLAETPRQTTDTVFQTEEAEPPSLTLAVRSGDGFSIGIPDNFGAENIGKSAGALKSWSFLGKRRGDSFIKIETFDASKNNKLKEIVEENRKFFGNGTPQKTTLGGKEAFRIDYKPAGKVKGKVWFAISGDKLYRVVINWFTDEEADFLPPFEKSVQSFKFD
ncbi:MAG: hypothetical protein M9949_12800 [Candidatus Kapabacteria bacterium]|nr:hypothetical protein [Candidatus Kapabacteria bacterium]